MRKNIIKQKMLDGQPVLGVFEGFNSPNLAEMFGYSGFDFIIFDTEHGYMSIETCESLIRAAECTNLVPIIRVTGNERPFILRSLDIGAMGVQVPVVNTREEAEKAVKLAKYAPIGERGLAFGTRAGGYGMAIGKNEHLETSNSETLVIVHLETEKAKDNLDEILKVDNLDVVFIGPADLSQSMGYPGQPDHPVVQKTIEESIEKIVAGGKIAGIYAGNLKATEKWIKAGAKYIAVGVGAVISSAMKEYAKGFKQIAGRL